MNRSEVEALVHELEPSIAEQLGTDLEDAREFSLVTLYAIECTPRLMNCTRESLAASILTAAKMRLVPGLGLGRLSANRGDNGAQEALFTPSWRGLLQLLQDHAGVIDAWSEVVYERDKFSYRPGSNEAREDLEFEPCSWGPSRGAVLGVFVRLVLETRSLQRLTHTEMLWRQGDIDPVTPDGSDPPESARGKSVHDYNEFIRTVAFKRAAKWCASRTRKGSSVIAAAIELERGAERSRVVPSATHVARMLGIDIPSSLSNHDEKAPAPTRVEASSGEAGRPRCCGCGNLADGDLIPFKPHARVWRACLGCGRLGLDHHFCFTCFDQHVKARRKIEAEEAKDDETRRANAAARQSSNVVEKRIKRAQKDPSPTPAYGTTPEGSESQGALASVLEPDAAASSVHPVSERVNVRDREAAAPNSTDAARSS